MLKRIAAIVAGGVLALTGLFFVAGRPISDLFGYFRAGAATTVKSIESEIPDRVHDEKAATELASARERLVDRQVQLNLSQNQLKNLEHEITGLEKAIADRSQVLASAYPVLQSTVEGGKSKVTFVSTNFSLEEFQHEIDDLLSMQERDENALRIKRSGYERLQKSVTDGESALLAMKNEMLEIEQEFAILKTRRDQARMEADTLDLVAGAASTTQSTTADIGKSIDRLQGQVEHLEARNAARRDVAPVGERISSGRLSQSFNRMDALKKYADRKVNSSENKQSAEDRNTRLEAAKEPNATSTLTTPLNAEEVLIHIKGEKVKKPE